MSKKETRQHGIRNKLFAAIAMLLVSSIMVVSTTYAWFTLSTAPEVQGITTTVGANGNLEIALMPYDGDVNKVTSAVGDSTIPDNFIKNMTWGNLIDLNDTDYALESITLLPARLNMAAGAVNTSPLMTPNYGADGRVTALEANTTIGARPITVTGTDINFGEGWEVRANAGGVRAIGTSSTMSEFAITFYNNISKMASLMGSAQDSAENSLNKNGTALASMAVAHANASGTDSNDYAQYLDEMTSVLAELQAANESLEQAILAGILAAAASTANTNVDAYNLVKGWVTAEDADLASVWSNLNAADGPIGLISGTALGSAYSTWVDINTKLAESNTKLAEIDATDGVSWAEASPVLSNLMNTSGIKINDKNLSDFKELVSYGTMKEIDVPEGEHEKWEEGQAFITQLLGGISLQLGADSGIFYDLASATGNIDAGITLSGIQYGTLVAPPLPTTIKTTAATPCYIEDTRVKLTALGPMSPDGAATSNVLDTTYGYIVDFLFRTNATGSNLLLQTDAAQRVYEDSSSTATMGHGSTMTFSTQYMSEEAVRGLMEAIRVVFMDYSTKDIYGIAKLDVDALSREEITPAEGDTPAVVELTAKLYLYEITSTDATTQLAFGAQKTGDDAVICALAANTATAVSAMVYLDGDMVDNSDVASEAPSMVGTLNLQFASSEDLVPMENSGLKNAQGEEGTVNIWTDVTLTAEGLDEGESVAVTVNCIDQDSIESMTTSDKTITLTAEAPTQTIKVIKGTYQGVEVKYTVEKPDGYTLTETSTDNWVIAPEAAAGGN